MLQQTQQIDIMHSSQSMQSIFEEEKIEIPEIMQLKSDQPSPDFAVSHHPVLAQNKNVS